VFLEPSRGYPYAALRDQWLPIGLEEDDEGAGPTILMSSRDGDHLAIARPSGAIDVLSLASAPRRRPAGNTMTTIPFPEATLGVSAGGQLYRFRGDRPEPIDDIGAAPADLRPAVVGDRAVVATTSGFVVVDEGGAPGRLGPEGTDAVIRADGAGGVVGVVGGMVLVVPDLENPDHGDVFPVEGVEAPEVVTDLAVALDEDRAYLTTNFGRLLAVDLDSGDTVADHLAAPGLTSLAVAVVEGADGATRVLTYGGDGVLRVHGSDLEVVDARSLPGAGRMLVTSPDGALVLAGTVDGDVVLLDSATLVTLQRLASDRRSNATYQFTDDGGSIIGAVLLSDSPSSETNEVEEIPVRTAHG
jgi:hypothetical protein